MRSGRNPSTARGLASALSFAHATSATHISKLTSSASGRAPVIATLAKLGPREVDWADPSNELVGLWSDDGTRTFRSEVLTPIDSKRPHWLPNLERATGHHAISETLGIISLAGGAGSGLKDLALKNQVGWHRCS